MIEIAKEKPQTMRRSLEDQGASRSITRTRYGGDARATSCAARMELPEDDCRERNEPKPWIRDKALEARVDRLKTVRDKWRRS